LFSAEKGRGSPVVKRRVEALEEFQKDEAEGIASLDEATTPVERF
jgi:hypothetical protein